MSQVRHALPPPSIDYPEDDGEPMADNTLQFKWIVLIKENLETLFASDPNVFVAGNLLWYAVEGKPELRAAPDAMVVFGRPKGYRRSYMQWREDDIPPQVVFEVLSPGNRRLEMERKFRFYFRYGAKEYYIYDPDSGALQGWLRGRKEFRPVPNIQGYKSPRLGIRFFPRPGRDSLLIIGPDGAPFLTHQELQQERNANAERARLAIEQASESKRLARDAQAKAEREKTKAEREKTKARQEHDRAEQEKAKAERLAARLRELGVEPD